ncbi:AEC family transporter [Reinekea marina]|uniref:AEC family transporter n=1 Tax=Reinekea marina TaxID=1310421 RepID=A0ABV7WR29_9GAMM|nr:AEC family transporter [Reinekea marina]MDN3648119.1 AEC family transporter [Reinekea marina]
MPQHFSLLSSEIIYVLEYLLFSIEISLPIAIVIMLGVWFKRLGWINEAFTQAGSSLVFKVTLPCLLFINIIQTDASLASGGPIIGFAAAMSLGWFMVLSLITYWVTKHRDERGVFVQGSFRGNMGILGLAYCLSAFGQEASALASLYLAGITLVYNILAVITLNRWAYQPGDSSNIQSTALNLIKNPLIIAIFIAFAWRSSGVSVPNFVISSGEYLAQLTLPLALLCIGASLSWSGFVSSGRVTLIATSFKLVLIPYSSVLIGYYFGFRGLELGVMYLMMATPTAAASYMMVRAMGGNANMAASIIAFSTVISLITTSIGLVGMKALNWI